MNTKIFVYVVALIVIVSGGALYFSKSSSSDSSGDTAGANMTADQMAAMHNPSESTSNSAMLAEDNAVIVTDQRPGRTVTGTVHLAVPGFLVIHSESGAILGSSALLHVGDNTNVNVTISRSAKDGEKLIAMLHSDTDNNGSFDASKDTPIQSKRGGAIQGSFQVSLSASRNMPISI